MTERLPQPGYLVALAEIELALGRDEAAARDLDLVRVQRRLLSAAGTRPDVEGVLFEADHGSPARAVRRGRASLMAEAPSVRSADALGWALTRAGKPGRGPAARSTGAAPRLARPGASTTTPGMAARGAGRAGLARRELRRALALNPSFSPLHAARARRALESLR